jgi:hypothetical protein
MGSRGRAAGGRTVASLAMLALAMPGLATLGACGDEGARAAAGRIADVAVDGRTTFSSPADGRSGGGDPRSLARAAGAPDGRRYTVRPSAMPGVLVGRASGGVPRDTSIAPTHDLAVCQPFTESAVPSRDGGVGNAVVWLEGVAEGPKDDAPRRVRLTLDGCRLEPRVQRVAEGGTVMINSRDAMTSRLQFLALGETRSRATVLLNDAGQVVPTSTVTVPAGLVEVRDDLHPWVRAWLAVTPHPFVAVTTADGTFRFDNVPPGRYVMVAWHERLGVRRIRVTIEAGVQTDVDVPFR